MANHMETGAACVVDLNDESTETNGRYAFYIVDVFRPQDLFNVIPVVGKLMTNVLFGQFALLTFQGCLNP